MGSAPNQDETEDSELSKGYSGQPKSYCFLSSFLCTVPKPLLETTNPRSLVSVVIYKHFTLSKRDFQEE